MHLVRRERPVDTGSTMLANHADSARQSVVENGRSANTARTLRSSASTQMARELGPRSTQTHVRVRLELTHDRQFGSMAEKMADFERLLKDLMLRVDDEDAANIKGLLEQVENSTGDHR